ncbi:hypothetical protein ACROYT_G035630 [Oculina patagonica]
MRPKELLVVLLVVVSSTQWQKGCAQEYYDLYSNNEFYREKKNDIQSEDLAAPTSSDSSRHERASPLPMPANYDSLVGHPASPTPMKVPTLAALVSALTVVLIIVVLSLIHLVRKRQRSLLQKEFAMTLEDTELSSTALGNDPYRSVSGRASYESFTIPMPDDPSQASSFLAPQISLTSAAGKTTHLYP